MKRLAAVGALKLSLFLKQRVGDDFFKRYSRLIVDDVTEEEVSACPQTPEELFDDAPVLRERWGKLCSLCGEDPIALTAVQLYILALMEERTQNLLREGMGTAEGLTIETAGRIAFPKRESVEMIPELRTAFEKVSVLLQAEPGCEPMKAPFRLDWRLAAWLAGDDTPDERSGCVAVGGNAPLPASVLMGDEAFSTAARLKNSGFSMVHISGECGSGRRLFARQVARELDTELLIVPFDTVGEQGVLNIPAWRRVLRELLLGDRVLCLHDVTCPVPHRTEYIPALLRQIWNFAQQN